MEEKDRASSPASRQDRLDINIFLLQHSKPWTGRLEYRRVVQYGGRGGVTSLIAETNAKDKQTADTLEQLLRTP